MGALGCYLETAGVATTQISLIREHTEAINPPRALWVSFILGRPFGVPHDAAFQERVLLAALRLLEAPSGPVLADYPEDAPPTVAADTEGLICPVSFGRAADDHDTGALFLREIGEIMPWHDLARERRGRTTVGLSGLGIMDAAGMLASHLKGNTVACFEGLSAGETVKLICEDVRAYYYEAAAARPGALDAGAIQNWFWHETAAGRVFLAFHKLCLASPDKSLQQLCATSLVPRAVLVELSKS